MKEKNSSVETIVTFPSNVRCVVALSYDLEMCGGYQPGKDPLRAHGRIELSLQHYTLELCSIAEKYGVKLQFFVLGNGLEKNIQYLKEIIRRGYFIDNHTYSHISLRSSNPNEIDLELKRTNMLLRNRLQTGSVILRAPMCFTNGLSGLENVQRIILHNGFKFVSSQADWEICRKTDQEAASQSEYMRPFVYPTGLVEIPITGFMDRHFFEWSRNIDPKRYESWRIKDSVKFPERGFKPPWTPDDALDQWIKYNKMAFDYAYDNRKIWTPVWHPASHYLHDPKNRTLETILEYAFSKPDKVYFGNTRDLISMIHV